MSSTFIVIGAPGMGKSPFVRSMIHNRRCLVFDVQNEYGTKTKYEGQTPVGLTDDTTKPRSRYAGSDVNVFLKLASTRKNSIIVFEEATAFFGGKTEKELRRYCINRFHTNNTTLFIFHSIQSVPPFIFDTANFAVLFKTMDVPKNIKAKRPELLDAYEALKEQPNGNKIILKLI